MMMDLEKMTDGATQEKLELKQIKMLAIKLDNEIKTTTMQSVEIHLGLPMTMKSKRSLNLFNSKFLSKHHLHQSSIQDSLQEENLPLLSDQFVKIWNHYILI